MSSGDFVWPLHRPPLNDPWDPYQALFAAGATRVVMERFDRARSLALTERYRVSLSCPLAPVWRSPTPTAAWLAGPLQTPATSRAARLPLQPSSHGMRVVGYKKARELEFVDASPENPSGKILRRVLRGRAQDHSP